MNHLGDYDVIVIGAGHAGIEAAHAAATLGAKTAVFTMSLDAIGNSVARAYYDHIVISKERWYANWMRWAV